jgi:sulfopyruvate decarboxylase TPP-binding subunit
MRGDFGEGNAWQLAMGKSTQPVLEASGITCLAVDREEDLIPTARAACTMAYQSDDAIAVLLTQKLLGAKAFPSG